MKSTNNQTQIIEQNNLQIEDINEKKRISTEAVDKSSGVDAKDVIEILKIVCGIALIFLANKAVSRGKNVSLSLGKASINITS